MTLRDNSEQDDETTKHHVRLHWSFELLGTFLVVFVLTHIDAIWHWLERILAQ